MKFMGTSCMTYLVLALFYSDPKNNVCMKLEIMCLVGRLAVSKCEFFFLENESGTSIILIINFNINNQPCSLLRFKFSFWLSALGWWSFCTSFNILSSISPALSSLQFSLVIPSITFEHVTPLNTINFPKTGQPIDDDLI